MSPSRLVLVLGIALIAAACGDSERGSDGAGPTATVPSTTDTGGPGPVIPAGPSALDDMFAEEFPDPLVDPEEILSGGPPPDGIPPIDEPNFVTIADADVYLEDQEGVVVIELNGEAKAYPVQVMIWHEIVNDTVGGVPVSVTYCPLCSSAVSYVREINGVETTFGTSGRLFASALVMYDRLTESLWTHFDGKAVVGVLTGAELAVVPSPLLAWGDFKEIYPDGMVLDKRTTGFQRDYGRNPYIDYDNPDTNPFLFRGDVDERAAAKQRVVGVEIGDATVAFALAAISDDSGIAAHNTSVGAADVAIFWASGQATALEDINIDRGRDIGSVGVFVPEAGGRSLTFTVDNEQIIDTQTGSSWNVAGKAIDGPLAGEQLARIHHLDTFWFAWSTYQPETDLVEEL